MFTFILYWYCPVKVEALRRTDPPCKESYRIRLRK
jgi:hypothetical protein